MPPRPVVLVSPIAGLLDTLYPQLPIPLLAICRRLDTARFPVVIVDQRMPGWRERLDEALARDPVLVGITSLTGDQLHFGAMLARYARSRCRAPVVWGGVHPTCAPQHLLREGLADLVLRGEGEEVFPALVAALEANESPRHLPGLAWLDADGAMHENPAGALLDITELPDPPYHLLDMHAYAAAIGDHEVHVEGARGCRFGCTFCYNPVYNQQRWRPRSAARLVGNLRWLHERHGARNFFINDDSFLLSPARTAAFADGLAEAGMDIRWSTEGNLVSLERMSDAELERLVSLGFHWMSIGVENGSRRIRRLLRKDIDEERLYRFNRRAARLGFRARYNFVTGTPWETADDLRQTVAMIERLLAENPSAWVQGCYVTTPYPGTVYLEQCREHGLAEPRSTAVWADFDPFTVGKHLPWMRGERGRQFELLMFASLFVDHKADYHVGASAFGRLVSALGRAYRPVARGRLHHLWATPFPEAAVIKTGIRLQRARVRRQLGLGRP
ncbi:MAG: radical SAM protein [Pseudomonadota bacterium]